MMNHKVITFIHLDLFDTAISFIAMTNCHAYSIWKNHSKSDVISVDSVKGVHYPAASLASVGIYFGERILQSHNGFSCVSNN